jgi:prophage regulatory protein
MTEVYVSDRQVALRYGMHRSAVWRWVKTIPDFPKPVVLSPGCTRWKLADIVAWEQSKEKAK